MLSLVVATSAERPDRSDLEELHRIWPEYNLHGEVLNRYWRRLYDDLPELQFVLYDEDEGVVLAEGHTIPFAWDGTAEGLPDGINGVVANGLSLWDEGGAPT